MRNINKAVTYLGLDSTTRIGAIAAAGVAVFLFILSLSQKKKGKTVTRAGGGLPFLGHLFIMLKGSPWDQMAAWAVEYGTFYTLHLFGSDSYVVSDPEFLKIIMQTKLSSFKKDVAWTYKPFMVLLGNGLVTAEGDSWKKQRHLLSSHLRLDILDEIPSITITAVQRLKLKLDKAKDEGTVVEMSEVC
jgi:cytochrome P450